MYVCVCVCIHTPPKIYTWKWRNVQGTQNTFTSADIVVQWTIETEALDGNHDLVIILDFQSKALEFGC